VKRRLRQKRRWLTLGAWVLVVVGGAVLYSWFDDTPLTREENYVTDSSKAQPVSSTIQTESEPEHLKITLERIRSQGGKRQVLLQTNYVCGEEVVKLGEKKADEIIALHRENPDWSIAIHQEGEVYFIQVVNDLSPQCKESAYFGLDRNGNLSLFQGLPGEEQVLRTFFQLNVEYLETSLPRETVEHLRQGIRVTDLAEYNSVLSTFSDYAMEEMT
jgi:forespore regulator of the sigma-K checkpoint